MSISENEYKPKKEFNPIVLISTVLILTIIALCVWAGNADKDERLKREEAKQKIWKDHYASFMSDCQKAQRLKTCCLNDFKNTYLHAYETTPEFCKSSEVRKAESEARQGSSGQSLGDSVKQGVGVGIGLKVINSIL